MKNFIVDENWVRENYHGETNFTIPEVATSIGEYAFLECENLTSVKIPDSVMKIGADAFDGCCNLTSVNIPDSVTEIGRRAFDGCESLASVDIPDGVTEIGAHAFLGCENLTSVNIPDSVTVIGDRAFDNCNNLKIICNKGSYAEMYVKNNGLKIAYNLIAKEKNNYIAEAKQLAETYSDAINEFLCKEENLYVAYAGVHSFFNTANTIDVNAPVVRSVSKNGKPDFRIPGGNFASLPCNGLAVSAWKDMLVSLTFTTENEPEKIQVAPEVYPEIKNHISSRNEALAGYYDGLGEAVKDIDRSAEYGVQDIRNFAYDCQEKGQEYLEDGEAEMTYAYRLGKANALYDAGDILNRAADKLEEKLKQRNIEKDEER